MAAGRSHETSQPRASGIEKPISAQVVLGANAVPVLDALGIFDALRVTGIHACHEPRTKEGIENREVLLGAGPCRYQA